MDAPPQVPQRGPYRKMPVTRAVFYITLRIPRKGATPSRFPSQSFHRERCPVSRVPFQLSLIVPGERTLLFLNRAPVEKGAFFHSLLKSPVDELPANSPEGPH